jgi:TetR/AcrR family transcriptional regulator
MLHDNKDRLLDAAIELFAEYGYDKVSIRQIAEKAQANSAMISYYFGSKQQLYQAALQNQIQSLAAFSQEQFDSLEPCDIFRRYAAIMLDIHQKSPAVIKFICREFIAPNPADQTVFHHLAPALYQVFASALQRGIKQGLFRTGLLIRPTIILWIGMVNFHYISQNLHNIVPPESAADNEKNYMDQAVEIFLQGIARKD